MWKSILSNSDLNLTPYSCEHAASCHPNHDSLVCENFLSLHPFPSSQEENLDEVTEETVVSKKLTQSLITSQVITSQKIIQSLNGDASELIEEAKEKAKKVPQGSVQQRICVAELDLIRLFQTGRQTNARSLLFLST